MSSYEPPSGEMTNEQLCHYCHERTPQAGLTLNNIPCCKPCFDQAEEKSRAKPYVPKITEIKGVGGVVIVGYNPPQK